MGVCRQGRAQRAVRPVHRDRVRISDALRRLRTRIWPAHLVLPRDARPERRGRDPDPRRWRPQPEVAATTTPAAVAELVELVRSGPAGTGDASITAVDELVQSPRVLCAPRGRMERRGQPGWEPPPAGRHPETGAVVGVGRDGRMSAPRTVGVCAAQRRRRSPRRAAPSLTSVIFGGAGGVLLFRVRRGRGPA